MRDGFGTSKEDKSRRFYKEGETKEFEHIECEWPIFYLYMIVDGVFKGLTDQIELYCKLATQRILRDSQGDPVVPMYFSVPKDCIQQECASPGSQKRIPSAEGSPESLFMWGQSMYIIAQLLTSGLIHINEIDPIRRYLPSSARPRKGFKYSAFQVE